MARPTANNCAYFSHDAGMRNHPKVKALRLKFKDHGYQVWCMLLEYLTGADGNVFKYSPMQFEIMSGDFMVPGDHIQEIVDYCLKIEMLFNRDGFIESDSLNERLAPVYAKRARRREQSQEQLREKGKFKAVSVTETPEVSVVSVTETPVSGPETPQSKVKESKVKKTKDITESAKSPPLPKPPTDFDLCKDFWLLEFKDGWTFNATKGKALKGIISQIQVLIKNNPPKDGQEVLSVCDMFRLICSRLPEWFHDKDLPVINSKFNEIITQIKNQKSNGKSKSEQNPYHN